MNMGLSIPFDPLGLFKAPASNRVVPGQGPVSVQWLGANKMHVSGSISVSAPPSTVWSVLTDYEQFSNVIPNLIASEVTVSPDGKVLIDQTGLLSRKLNLKTRVTLEVSLEHNKKLKLSKVSGDSFLEFEAEYLLHERSHGGCVLEYTVTLVPMPLFPLPLVDSKVRKEVPNMLLAFRNAAVRKQRQQQLEDRGARLKQAQRSAVSVQ